MLNIIQIINDWRLMLIEKNAFPVLTIYSTQTEITPKQFKQDMTLTTIEWVNKDPKAKAEVKRMMQEYIDKN